MENRKWRMGKAITAIVTSVAVFYCQVAWANPVSPGMTDSPFAGAVREIQLAGVAREMQLAGELGTTSPQLPSHEIFPASPSQFPSFSLPQPLAPSRISNAGVATWGVLEAAEKIDAGPLGEAGLILLGTSIANAAVQVATNDQLQAKDFGNVLGGEIKESVQNIVKSTLSLGTNVDRNTPYGETVYQQKITEVAKKVKEQGLGETLEQSLTEVILGEAKEDLSGVVEPVVRQTVELVTGAVRKVLIDGKKPATERVLDENNKVITADDGSETILSLGKGDYTARMKYNAGQFEAVQVLNKGRVLTPQEMAFVMEQLGIEAGRLIEITPAQREQDKVEFKKFTDEVQAQLSQKLGQEKAAAVVNDLKQAGEKLIEDPTKTKEVKSELSQKKPETTLTKEEWRSASQILEGVAEKFRQTGVQMGADGNVVGGFLTYFAGTGVEFAADPLKFGEGLGQASVAAEQGHYGEAALYVVQDAFRAAALVPGMAGLAKSVNRGIEEAIAAGRTAEPVAGNIANRFAQAWRNLWNPLEKTYQTSNGVLRNTTKEIQFFDDLGNLKGAIGKQTAAGAVRGEASVAEDAVKLLREGKATSQQVAELANGKLVNKEVIVDQTLGGMKTGLNTDGKISELANVLRETDGIEGANKLFSGEIKTVRHYIRTEDAVDKIKAAGKLDPTQTKDGKIFFTIQDLNPTEAEQILALAGKPVAYVDIPISRIQSAVDEVKQVARSDLFNQPGGGIEIVTKKEIDISDLIDKIVKLAD